MEHAVQETPMCLAVPAEARRSAPPMSKESKTSRIRDARSPVLIFTLLDDCPARLCSEDLADPNRFHQRLKAWLLRQT